jgi:type IV pilus biogenesis protein CpaD/CtpE
MSIFYVNIKFNLLMLLPVFLLSACVASPPPYMDAKFGESVEMAKAQQTANPDASLDTTAVVGIDGQAGDAAFDNYRDSFINRPTPSRGVVDIGTSGGSNAR